jgi:hypothetical protein
MVHTVALFDMNDELFQQPALTPAATVVTKLYSGGIGTEPRSIQVEREQREAVAEPGVIEVCASQLFSMEQYFSHYISAYCFVVNYNHLTTSMIYLIIIKCCRPWPAPVARQMRCILLIGVKRGRVCVRFVPVNCFPWNSISVTIY